MFKKTNKQNIRKRRDAEEDNSDGEKAIVNNMTKPISVKSQSSGKKDKKKESKQASLLSFDNGEEDDLTELKLKKSSRSRRIAKEIKKRSQQEKEASSNPAGTNGSTNQGNGKNIHVFKPLKQKQDETKLPIASSTKESVSVIPNFDSGVIPTPTMIHAARKQREMLRKFGSEYISAEDTQKYKETSQSRLVRDDDDDSSDDGIVEMKGIEKKNENSSSKFVPNESDEEDDKIKEEENAEELCRWEEEMIKKGINAQTNQSLPSIPPPIPPPSFFNTFGDYYNNSDQQFSQYSYRQVETKSDVTFDNIKKRLEDHLNGLKLRNQSNVDEMDKLDQDTSECNDMSKHLGDVKSISEEYQFYQEMHQYVKDLVGCLRENVKVINSLEENAHLLWKNQAERIISRRRQDVQDESNQIAFANKGTHDKNPNNAPEFIARVREREARRTRRRASRQIKQRTTSHFDGLSTDDEETTMDQAQFNTEFQRIQSLCTSLFDDVLDDFCILQNILQRFDNWRKLHNDSYNDAYIALCIPKILFPFIRQRMILWNPLLSSTSHFEEENWYRDLSMFGLKLFPLNGQEDNGNILDDAKILSSVVEKVLCVKLLFFIQHVWDPMSTEQTVRLCLILKDLNRNYPFMTADHHQCQKLFQGVCKRLQSAVDNDIFIPLLPASSADSPVHAFLERQTWASIKLFKNAMLLDGILSYKVLCEVAIESILNRYILLALQISVMSVSCLYKCQKIVDSIPKHWMREQEDLRKQLSSLARFLVHFAQSIKTSEQIASKTMLKQIKTMLLVIGARDALLQI